MILASDAPSPEDEAISRIDFPRVLGAASDRGASVLVLRGMGYTLREVGELIGVSPGRARQIEAKAARKVREKFGPRAPVDRAAWLEGRRKLAEMRAYYAAKESPPEVRRSEPDLAHVYVPRPLEGLFSVLPPVLPEWMFGPRVPRHGGVNNFSIPGFR